jgi:hypothetical protein
LIQIACEKASTQSVSGKETFLIASSVRLPSILEIVAETLFVASCIIADARSLFVRKPLSATPFI